MEVPFCGAASGRPVRFFLLVWVVVTLNSCAPSSSRRSAGRSGSPVLGGHVTGRISETRGQKLAGFLGWNKPTVRFTRVPQKGMPPCDRKRQQRRPQVTCSGPPGRCYGCCVLDRAPSRCLVTAASAHPTTARDPAALERGNLPPSRTHSKQMLVFPAGTRPTLRACPRPHIPLLGAASRQAR